MSPEFRLARTSELNFAYPPVPPSCPSLLHITHLFYLHRQCLALRSLIQSRRIWAWFFCKVGLYTRATNVRPNSNALLELPAYPAPAAAPFGMGVVQDAEAAPNKLGCKVNRRPVEKREGDCVNEEVRGLYGGMTKVTAKRARINCLSRREGRGHLLVVQCPGFRELHFVLIAMAAAGLDRYSQCGVRTGLPV